MSISELFQPIKYDDNKDIELVFYKDYFEECDLDKFISFTFNINEFEDYIFNNDKIIRYIIYNNLQFNRNYYYEGIDVVGENKFRILFGT